MSRKRKELPLLESVRINGVAAEGKSIARVKLRETDETPIVVFIPYGAPGDIVDIKVDRKKHNYADAHIVGLREPSPLRIEPRCRHFGTCGGCKWQHILYESQLEFKRNQVIDAIERIAKVEHPEVAPTLPSETFFYRNKMEYTFSNKKWRTWEEMRSSEETESTNNALGFHISGAFDKVLDIEECFLQAPIGDNIRNFLRELAETKGYTFYDIKNNEGLLRNLMIRISSTGQIMVCVVFGEDDKEAVIEIMNSLAMQFPQITSLLYIVNKKLNDSIADQKIHSFKGEDYIEEEMEGLKFRVNAKSFYQTNSRQAYQLYKKTREFAGLGNASEWKKPIVYDLYTGAGTIANFVAKNAEKVIGIEYVEEAIEDAKLNSKINGVDNTIFYAGDMKDILTNDFIKTNGQPDVMIVDPPRAGMHQDVVGVIMDTEPKVIVYVSCNPATQARDLALMDSKYRITDIQPVDMFPHTHHVENIVRLELRNP